MKRITPVLLSGGTGTRLWPLSREAFPKQLLRLLGDETLLQATARRVADQARFAPLIVVANAEASDAEALLLVMPADHHIADPGAFVAAVDAARPAAEQGSMVLFGLRPTSPATGYGYIRVGPALGENAYRVTRFVEKPDRTTAERYLADGDYIWNSGIFLLPAAVFLDEVARLEPDMIGICRAALEGATADLDFVRLAPEAFGRARSVSLDHAVMEKTARAVVVRAQFPWTDVGAWSAVADLTEKDAHGNATHGDVLTVEAQGCYVRSEGPLVAVSGVADLIVVATPDAVLVTSKTHDQDVKVVVDRLKQNGHHSAIETVQVHRPWGCFYQSLHNGDRFQVKRITVNPGAKLSLQKHFHRAEHWVVVNGTALVTRDGEQMLLRENESTFLPLGCVHRLENPGQIPLNLIEVQSGSYLGEDDIVRLEDGYGRP
jgi:mannose-1-phosphate guanylyltransferase/mannose-1-phosphate guanylyltransferase/mannose-6-phosphate isomerase